MECPNCGSGHVLDIIYGYLPMDLMMKKESGELAWGGLFLPEDAPAHRCADCGHEW